MSIEFKDVALADEAQYEQFIDQIGTGHPDAFVPGFVPEANDVVDDVDIGLKAWLLETFPSRFPDPETENGSEWSPQGFDVAHHEYTDAMLKGPVTVRFHTHWDDEPHEVVVELTGSYQSYGAGTNGRRGGESGVCFVVDPTRVSFIETGDIEPIDAVAPIRGAFEVGEHSHGHSGIPPAHDWAGK